MRDRAGIVTLTHTGVRLLAEKRDISRDPLAYVVLGLLALCFGSSLYFQSIALRSFGPTAVTAWRLIGAALVLVLVAVITGQGLVRTRELWKWAVLNGFTGFLIPFYLMIWAQQHVPTSLIGILFAGIPLMVLAMSALVFSLRITVRKILGLCIGLAGVIILIEPGDTSSTSEYATLAKAAAVLTMVILASSAILIRKMPVCPPISAVASASLVAALVSIPFAASSIPEAAVPANAILALAATGLVSTGLGQFFRYFLIRRKGPVFIAPNSYLAAMVAAMLGVLLLGEPVSVALVLGFVVILIGLVVSEDGSGRMNQAD